MTSSNLRSKAACYSSKLQTPSLYNSLHYRYTYIHVYAYCKHFTLTKQPKMNLSP